MMNLESLDLSEGQRLADELTSLAEQHDDHAEKLEAHHAQWNTRWLRGELRAARVNTEYGIALYSQREHAALASRFGDMTRAYALAAPADNCCGCWAILTEPRR